MGFRLLAEAEADLATIADRIADDSPMAALRWQEAMLTCCRNLGDMPGMGVARPAVRPDLRMFPCGKYLILYREAAGGVEIVRVIHGARDWQALL